MGVLANRRSMLLLVILFFLLASFKLYAFGKKEAAEKEIFNKEWTVALTEFDVSQLSSAGTVFGNLFQTGILNVLKDSTHRRLTDEELRYYTEREDIRIKKEALKKIEAKQQERDNLLFAGSNSYTYKTELKKKDAELAELYKEYNALHETAPVVEPLPLLILHAENQKNIYLKPPDKGAEYNFCKTQKVNVFISGSISEYHGRFVASVKIYSATERKHTWESSEIFSSEDIMQAVNDISAEIIDELSRQRPALILVRATPESSTIIIRDKLAGHGETTLLETNAGDAEITVFADGYRQRNVSVPLAENEITEVDIVLRPQERVDYSVAVKPDTKPTAKNSAPQIQDDGDNTFSVYRGALYEGQAPLRLTADKGADQHNSIIDERGRGGSTSFAADGKAVELGLVYPKPDDNIEVYRKRFYGSSGRFWVSLPLAVVMNGIAASYTGYVQRNYAPAMFDAYYVTQGLAWGSIAVTVGFFVESVVRFLLYLRAAGEAAPPVSVNQVRPLVNNAATSAATMDATPLVIEETPPPAIEESSPSLENMEPAP
jgi:hypothetical protein